MRTMFLILAFLTPGKPSPHALYLSVTEVWQSDEETLKIRVKVFTNDLELALRNYSDGFRRAPEGEFLYKNRGIASGYFNEHFQLRINGKNLNLVYLSHTIENDAHYLVFRTSQNEEWDQIECRADFFMELFPTQQNVVQFHREQDVKFLRFELGTGRQNLSMKE